MPLFPRYVGIDYSGAETPTSNLKGLRVYEADRLTEPREFKPPQSSRKYWTRRGIAEWLVEQLSGEIPILVGIDHAFSFPMAYFKRNRLPHDWAAFLNDFYQHWPTDEDHIEVKSLRKGNTRTGDISELRLTETWTTAAKSVFQFGVPGQVATSTHAGLPWLRYLRAKCPERVHFWPFDGWDIPHGRSVIAEVYPSLWMKRFPIEGRNGDQHAAYSVAAWMRRSDRDGWLQGCFNPPLEPDERTKAGIEGWIIGVL